MAICGGQVIPDTTIESGQIWTLSPGGCARVLNKPVPPAFQESVRCAEQNLYARATTLVGDRDPRSHEFSMQLRGFDAAKSGAKTGVACLIALSSALLHKSVRGGLIVVGELSATVIRPLR